MYLYTVALDLPVWCTSSVVLTELCWPRIVVMACLTWSPTGIESSLCVTRRLWKVSEKNAMESRGIGSGMSASASSDSIVR